MLDVLIWLLAAEGLGLLAVPVALLLFRNLGDRGYAFAKPLGLLLLSLPIWLLGSLGILPITRWSILLVLVLFLGITTWLWRRHHADFMALWRRERTLILATEVVFLLVFVGWTLYRAYDPAINHTEQPMDFAFLNASIVSPTYPPEDPWLRGFGVSYYYFGYLMLGLLTKITGLPSGIAYNLSLSLIAAMTSACAFGLVAGLIRKGGGAMGTSISFGVFAVLLVGIVGNLEGVLELIRAAGAGSQGFWQELGIKGLEGPAISTTWYPQDTWWWWRATRVIDTVVGGQSLDYTIHEFPFFSFLLGDLHPHLMAIPFILLTLGFALELISDNTPLSLSWLRDHWCQILLMGLAVGALGFINSWDLPALFAFLLGTLAYRSYRDLYRLRRQDGGQLPIAISNAAKDPNGTKAYRVHRRRGVVLSALALAGILFALVIIPYIPYYQNLNNQVQGVAPVTGHMTHPLHFLVVWGLFCVILAPFIAIQVTRALQQRSWKRASFALASGTALFSLWLLSVIPLGLVEDIPSRFLHLTPGMMLLALVFYRLSQKEKEGTRDEDPGLIFTLALIGFGMILLIGPDLFYVVDFFNSRMNTVFKLYYQAWIVLAVASAMALYYWHSYLLKASVLVRRASQLWAAVILVLLLAALYYPAAASTTKSQGFRGTPTLDGLAYLNNQGRSGEYEAIRDLLHLAKPGEGILEAVGEDYSPHGTISAATGLPTIMGWVGHEIQWRGGDELLRGRAEEIRSIYTSQDAEEVRKLLQKYDIDYVVVGARERHAYGEAGLAKFEDIGEKVIATQDGLIVYRIRE
jgi:YYY domain-containing protein